MSIFNIRERLSERIHTAQQNTGKTYNKFKKFNRYGSDIGKGSLKEADVGITEFVSDLPGFHAVIKQRYSDFSVHEIDRQGKIIVLNSFELPDESAPIASIPASNLIRPDVLEKLDKLIDPTDATDLVEVDVTEISKDDRRNIHAFLKDKFGKRIISNTVDDAEKKVIKVFRSEGKSDNRRPNHLPKHLHFVLMKSNLDSNHALSILAKGLSMRANHFKMAGTKDKRAVTTQRISLKNVFAVQLRKLKGLRNLAVGNFEYKHEALYLGDLKGNNFQIALRDVKASNEEIERAVEQLKDGGFINYFGMQRFGSNVDSPTHEVGKLLLKEQYAQAFNLIIKPRGDVDHPDIRSAREIYARTRSAEQAFAALRHGKRSLEGNLLYGLKVNGPNAYANAFDAVPRPMRMLFIHAYQSFIWNKVASRRMTEHKCSVLEGDFVLIDDASDHVEDVEDVRAEDGGADKSEEGKELTDEKNKNDEKAVVRPITANELAKYTIHDVLLPIPGYSTKFPNNATSQFYTEELAKDGLTIEAFQARAHKNGCLSGAYRHILKKPSNLSYKVVAYKYPDTDLILSDLDIIDGRKLSEENGEHKALILKFDLSKGSYATMALREILRSDTSSGNQASMNPKRPAETNESCTPAKQLKKDDGVS